MSLDKPLGAPAYLIAGGDGQIGGALIPALSAGGASVRWTSRRKGAKHDALLLDLRSFERDSFPGSPLGKHIQANRPTVLLTAAMTGLKDCEADPEATRRVNVTNTLSFASECLSAGCFVVYLSSNAVFSGGRPFPAEADRPDAVSVYGRQKAEVESVLLGGAGDHDRSRTAIVRLTKVLPDAKGLIVGWIDSLQRRQPIQAMSDYFFSPVSLAFAVLALTKIARAGQGGIFHVSGSEDLSYHDFAILLAQAVGADAALVSPVKTGPGRGGGVPQGNCYSALGMTGTHRTTGIAPQAPAAVVRDILSSGEYASGAHPPASRA